MAKKAKADSTIIPSSEEAGLEPGEFWMERILAKKWDEKNDRYLYLVKWLGYPHSKNTWEPAEHFRSPEELAAFNEEQEKLKPSAMYSKASEKSSSSKRLASVKQFSPFDSPTKKKKTVLGQGGSRAASSFEDAKNEKFFDTSDSSSSADEGYEGESEDSTPQVKVEIGRKRNSFDPDVEPEVEPSDAGIPFDPDGPLVMIEPADGDDGFDRGWKMQAFVGLQLRPAAVGEGVREAWVGVKFAGYRRCQWIHISRVEEYEREALKQFLLKRLQASKFY